METWKPKRREGVVFKEMDLEGLLYDAAQSKIHVLNRAAGFVWEMCDGVHSTREMEQKMRQAYAVSAEVDLQEDLQRILQSFHDLGLLERFGD